MASVRIGDRVKVWRRRRGGMTQRVLADLSGLTQSYISQIESGRKPLDRRSTQVAIASALNITVAQLLGQPAENGDPARAQVVAHVPRIRSALIELASRERRRPQRDRDALRNAVREATDTAKGAEYADLAPLLPDLLIDLAGHGAAMTPELVEALHATLDVLKASGWQDLALLASEVSTRAARDYGEPAWIGFATFSQVQAFPPESAALGARATARVAEEIQGCLDRSSREIHGHLRLLSGLQAAVVAARPHAAACLDEAADLARSMGEPRRYSTFSAGIGGLWFGPSNVDMWRIAVAAELRDTGTALAVSDRIDPAAVPVPERWSHVWIDMARALAADGRRDRDAMLALAKAERAAPQHFRFNVVAVDLANTLIRRARRRVDAREMTSLARTIGLDNLEY